MDLAVFAVFAVFAALGMGVSVVPVVRKPGRGKFGGLRVRGAPPREGSVTAPGAGRDKSRRERSAFDTDYEGFHEEEEERREERREEKDDNEDTMNEDDERSSSSSPPPESNEPNRDIPGSIIGTALHGPAFAPIIEEEGWEALEVRVSPPPSPPHRFLILPTSECTVCMSQQGRQAS